MSAVKNAIQKINAQIQKTDPQLNAVFYPAEDESVDDSITVHRGETPTGISLQIGAGYFGVNRWVEDEMAMHHHFVGDDLDAAVEALIASVMKHDVR